MRIELSEPIQVPAESKETVQSTHPDLTFFRYNLEENSVRFTISGMDAFALSRAEFAEAALACEVDLAAIGANLGKIAIHLNTIRNAPR